MTFESQHRAQITIILTAYLGLAVAATATDFLYYADSAFFAFALASGHGWELLISESPRRIAALILTRLRGLGHFLVSRANKINGLVQKVFTTRPFLGGGPARRPIDSGKPGNSRFLRASKTNESVARDA